MELASATWRSSRHRGAGGVGVGILPAKKSFGRKATGEAMFASPEQSSALVQEWPLVRLVEWGTGFRARSFTDRKSRVRRLCQFVPGHAG